MVGLLWMGLGRLYLWMRKVGEGDVGLWRYSEWRGRKVNV